jgi:hypothetical protein
MGHEQFDAACLAYKADPCPSNLKALLLYAVSLEPEARWRNMRAPGALTVPFIQMRAVCDRALAEEEVRRFSGCLGYALKSTLAGEELDDPIVCYPVAGGKIAFTVMDYRWDSLSTTRTDPDYSQSFSRAREYVFAGTPLRTTDREGKGTKDTRLVEGIAPCNVSFFLR